MRQFLFGFLERVEVPVWIWLVVFLIAVVGAYHIGVFIQDLF